MLDVLITGGELYDGAGGPAVRADVGIAGDRIARIGPPGREGPDAARLVIDAAGQAVCPGFINILSHSNLSLLHDPRSLGELTQGVTTEVFGEGISMGPLTPRMKPSTAGWPPATRAEIRSVLARSGRWGDVTEAGSVLILQVDAEENQKWQGRMLAEIAAERGIDPVDAALDLIASDRSRVGSACFSMSEDNLRKALRRPWVAISSDGASMAPEGAFLRAPTHPRAYGSFARVLGHYVREEKLLPLAEAVHRMSGLPAATLGLRQRGLLREGYFADVVVFDPAAIADRATFASPHQLSVGVSEALVNGQVAVSSGDFAGHLPGRAVAGPGTRR